MVKESLSVLTDNFDRSAFAPIFFDPGAKDFIRKIKKLKRENPQLIVIDQLTEQIKELFLLRNPKIRFQKDYQSEWRVFLKKILRGKTAQTTGFWVYYPWRNCLIHCLNENQHLEQRTGRNVYLINQEEQKKFYQARIGILGLSIGSHVALTVAMTGGAKFLKMADPDSLASSNLNRVRGTLIDLGVNKTKMAARQIYEINPYAQIRIYPEGASEQNLTEFLLKPKLDVLIEEMDNLYLKIRVRDLARKHRLPVIMGTDNGDNIILDIERYDFDPDYPLLHGRLGNLKAEDLKNIPPVEMPKIAAKIAGAEIAALRMIKSVAEVGKTIYSWPQLGNAATLCGSALTYLARKIILKQRLKSGRIQVNLDELAGALAADDAEQRKKLLQALFAQK